MPTVMASEIAEQPEVMAATLDALLPLRDELRRVDAGRREVLFLARGTSDNAGVYGRYLLENHAGRGAALSAPSLSTHYGVRRDLSDTLVVSISQSGVTAEIVEAQAWLQSCGARAVAITNVADSELAEGADLALVTQAGEERAVPATKSHTTQLAAIAVIADALGPTDRSLEPLLRKVPDEMARLLDGRAGIDAAAAALEAQRPTLVTGRGLTFGTALEVGLKLEETCLRPVRGLSYADLRHGPIAVVDEHTIAVLVAAKDGPMVSGMTELASDLRELGATIIGLGGDERFQTTCDTVVAGPDLPETIAPLGLVVPGQLMVEALAGRLGLDPDNPRALSKVTQTDPEGTGVPGGS